MGNKIFENHTLDEYKKKYAKKLNKLKKYTDKQVIEYSNANNGKSLIEKGEWWHIEGCYYQVPSFFEQYKVPIIAISSLAVAGIATGIIVPIAINNNSTPTTPDKYFTITFDTDGGSEIESQKVKEGECAKKPETDPSKEGYDFYQWLDNDKTYNFETPVTQDITLKADWTIKMYTVSFYDSSSESEYTELKESIPYGSGVSVPVNPQTSEDKAFEGWYTSKSCLESEVYDFDTPVKGDLKLYANWTANPCTVNWYLTSNETAFKTEKVIKGSYLTQLNESEYQEILENYSDCELDGWYTESTFENQYYFDKTISETTSELNLYAKWKVNSQDFHVIGGHNVDSETGLTLKLISDDSNNLGNTLSEDNVTVTGSLFSIKGLSLMPTADTGSDELTVTKTYEYPTSSNGEGVSISKTYEVEIGSYSKLDTDSLELGEAKAKDADIKGSVYIPKRYYSETQGKWIDIHKIAKDAFKGNTNITDVYISVPTIEIGAGAFEDCSGLESIEFEDKSNTWEFNGKELDPSKDITEILASLKEGNSSDKSPTKTGLTFVPTDDETSYEVCEDNDDTTSLPENLLIPSYVYWDDVNKTWVTTYEEGKSKPVTGFFYGTLTNARGKGAFQGAAIKTVTFHAKSNITSIEKQTFQDCSALTGVYFLENQNDPKVEIKSIGDDAFNGTTMLTNIEIPNTVEYIGESAFNESGIESITIPESVKDIKDEDGNITTYGIGGSAFNGCESLNSVKINSNSISTIKKYTFTGCTSLKQFSVPICINTIEGSSFNASGLESLSFDDSVSSWKKGDTVYLDASGNNAEAKASNATKLVSLSESSTIIKDNTYKDFTFELVDETNPSKGYKLVKYTGDDAKINIPSYCYNEDDNAYYPVVEIAASTDLFKNNLKITSIVIPNTVESFESYTFYGMKNLQSIQLPINSNFTTIPEYAFFNTFKLTSIFIPDSVNKIGKFAFRTDWSKYDGEGLQYATFGSDNIKWNIDIRYWFDSVYTSKNSEPKKNAQALRSGNLDPGYGEREWRRIY